MDASAVIEQCTSTENLPTNNTLDQLDHVVAIGGGHGLGRVLSALNHLEGKLTGIVTTTDNGGSTGRLRETEEMALTGVLSTQLIHHLFIKHPTYKGSVLFSH